MHVLLTHLASTMCQGEWQPEIAPTCTTTSSTSSGTAVPRKPVSLGGTHSCFSPWRPNAPKMMPPEDVAIKPEGSPTASFSGCGEHPHQIYTPPQQRHHAHPMMSDLGPSPTKTPSGRPTRNVVRTRVNPPTPSRDDCVQLALESAEAILALEQRYRRGKAAPRYGEGGARLCDNPLCTSQGGQRLANRKGRTYRDEVCPHVRTCSSCYAYQRRLRKRMFGTGF